jgi:hypothetical protein
MIMFILTLLMIIYNIFAFCIFKNTIFYYVSGLETGIVIFLWAYTFTTTVEE